MAFRQYTRMRGLVRPHATFNGYSPVAVAKTYSFPAPNPSGPKQGIALIELGGGYTQADVNNYFQSLGLPIPPVTFVSIDGAKNTPDGANGAQGEVMLDICVAGGVTGGKIPIYVVTAGNTQNGFVDAITWAANSPNVSVISISWGGPEDQWGDSIQAMEAAFALCARNGKTVTVASGDNGSSDGLSGNHCDYPSSSPQVIGCGGTNLQPTGVEIVWNDGSKGGATGGGVSALFGMPSFQPASAIPGRGRGVPDVAGVADSSTGWQVLIDGQVYVFGGTSAVAPMWAGLIALLNQNLGKNLGFCTPLLYQHIATFKDINNGNNGTYIAKAGYDCCTGLGSPNGIKLLTALKGITPPPPPPPPPFGTTFNFSTSQAYAAGQEIGIKLPINLPAGIYSVSPLANHVAVA